MADFAVLDPVTERVRQDFAALAEIRDPDTDGWTRTVFSEPYRASRDWVRRRMADAGLTVHADGAGNLVGVLPGRDPAAPALVTGSHTDTVAAGGRFDGVVGVLGSLEVVRQLAEHDLRLDRDLLVIDFLGEESNDYGLSCLGSRSLAGELTAEHLDRRDLHGVSLAERYRGFGLDPSEVLASAGRFARRGLHRYVELHIEQGPVLEDRGVSIGVVTAIAAIRRLVASFAGRPDHAGTRPMGDRADALVAAAEAVLAVRQEGCGAPVHGVATTSRIESEPGSPNVVPGLARMYAEMRSVDDGWLTEAQRRLAAEIGHRAADHGVTVDLTWSSDNERVSASPDVHEVIGRAADAVGVSWEPVPSGATHDAVHLARLCPMGMIFVPSRGGRSHCPDEWTDPADIAIGIRVHAATLLELDRLPDRAA
ncbi:M20 family metallo-hydrolase [Amycolatopsis jiangsuensis]|uniref:N-carbamoyl-L-amino-acid hydrolase n=1 Tax=Amycolatopsis jiangsuensis TaxID=1181879 RepID=A0A840IPP9_9PSEU|nr:M20 family metallo-hydrolase [Amycolatopsis jiangsuensis]MBB4683843.1 N-carbamoyl-L-amino-acid hydrolase [Amycolatopsis jiangsuensis]